MLAELFSGLDIDDEVEEKSKFCAAEDFQPMFHSKNWFLDDNSSEVIAHKACYAYHCGDFVMAFDIFNKMLDQGEHNRVHKVGLYESIIRSALKIESLPRNIEDLLYSYEQFATEYGSQLQYWNSAALVLQHFPLRTAEYMKIVIMLCSTIDSPEHWKLFGFNPNIKKGPNYELAYRTRILALLEHNKEFAAGFVADRLQTSIKEANLNIDTLEESDERISTAKLKMATDLMRSDELRELGTDIKRPAHDCKCRVGVYKTAELIDSISKEFYGRYRWMFTGMLI